MDFRKASEFGLLIKCPIQHPGETPGASINLSAWLKQKQHGGASPVDNYLQVEALPRSFDLQDGVPVMAAVAGVIDGEPLPSIFNILQFNFRTAREEMLGVCGLVDRNTAYARKEHLAGRSFLSL